MQAIVQGLNSAGAAFVDFAGPMLIQSSVLIAVLLAVDAAVRQRVRAVFRYWIWLLVLAKLVLPPTLSLPTGLGRWFGDELTTAGGGFALSDVTPVVAEGWGGDFSDVGEPAWPVVAPGWSDVVGDSSGAGEETGLTWEGLAVVGYAAAAGMLVVLLVLRGRLVGRLIRRGRGSDGRLGAMLGQCCRELGVTGRIGLRISRRLVSPAACGLVRPTILMPEYLVGRLSGAELRAVLLHEVAHVRRGDLWVSFVQSVLGIVYFYHPLVWVANRAIRRVREQAVDETVLVTMAAGAGAYPATLVSVARLARSRAALNVRLVGVVESRSALAGRVKHILGRPMPRTAKLGAAGLATVALAAAVLLPMAKGQGVQRVETVGAEVPAEQAVVLETLGTWGASNWAGELDTENVSAERGEDGMRFTVREAGKRRVWIRYLDLPVDSDRYPMFVLRYRAKGVSGAGHYVIWVDDGTGPNSGGFTVFSDRQLTADGEVHELRSDLRRFHPAGPIEGIALGVTCDGEGPGVFELVGIRFEADATGEVTSVPDDRPMTVSVVDQRGRPVAGASVTVDSERRNFVRRAVTNSKGMAAVVPRGNAVNRHTLRVEREGMIGVRTRDAWSADGRPVRVRLTSMPGGRGRVLGFRVVDKGTGRPVAGAAVEARMGGRRYPSRTNAAGWSRISLPSPMPRTLCVHVKRAGYVPMRVRWYDGVGVPVRYVLGLARGETIGGVVVDESGAGVKDVKVHLEFPGDRREPGERVYLCDEIATTDAKGRWACDHVPADLTGISIRLRHSGYALQPVGARRPLPPMSALRAKTALMTIRTGVTVEGVVVDTRGRPIVGATVGEERWWWNYYPGRFHAKTNREGKFSLGRVGRGKLVLAAQASGYGPAVREISVGPGTSPVRFVLDRGRTIRGRVVDENGRAVTGAKVMVSRWRGGEYVKWDGCTDSRGRFVWRGAPSDDVMFRVTKRGYTAARERLAASGGEGVVRLSRWEAAGDDQRLTINN